MVGAAFAHPIDHGKRKWLMYLALSVCANAILLSMVQLNPNVDQILEMPVIKVNLMSMARPAPKAPPQIVKAEAAPQAATPAYITPVETAAVAPRKMTTIAEEVKKPEPEPVVMANVKPAPKPAVRPVKPLAVPPKPMPTPQPVQEMVKAEPEPVKETVTQQVREPQPTTDVKQVASEPVVAENAGADDSTVVYDAQYRSQIAPVYPRRSLEMGQQGMVTLHAEVLPNGNPRELKIAQSSGYRLLDMAALAAVKKWKFEPRNVDGNAVVSWVRVPVNFVIQ
tara:strand:- start:2703 stop:3545 length:843 start_codon:yes stop_codon:yes gene_type:complete